jgi:hypothetical protein
MARQKDRPEQEQIALESAAQEQSGIIREEDVEGGDELSIGGSPPSGAGGSRHSRAPTRDDVQAPHEPD